VSATRRSLRHSLARELRARILAGEWRPGERMPSEPELARRRTVSRSSVRAAITMLEEDGLVSRRHGSGTYVTHGPPPLNDLGRNFGVSSLIASTGMQPGTTEQSSGAVAAPAAVAEALGVAEGEPVSSLRRVRTADGRPVVDVTDWCRTEHLAPEELPEIAEGSIYAALADRGLAVFTGVAQLTPRNAGGDVARRLGVPSGTMLLTIDQVNRTANGIAVLVSREHYVADTFTFTLLRRGPGEAAEEER
jgi:GntR family transcriptional regulator